ncbi:MAG: hypothetical protein H6825_03540 [Planctomycetes bacterium]|nr:hypothetical protein [Planctomycetota bacterium]
MSDPHAEPHDAAHDAPQHDEPHAHDDSHLPAMAHGHPDDQGPGAAKGFFAMLAVFVAGTLLVRSSTGEAPPFVLEPLPAHEARDMAPPGSAREAEKAGIAAYGEGEYEAAISSFELALERGGPPDIDVYLASARLLQPEHDDDALAALAPRLSELMRTGRASTAAEARWTLAALQDAFGNLGREVELLHQSASDASDPHAAAAAARLAALGMAPHGEHGEDAGEHGTSDASEAAHGTPASEHEHP